MSINVGYSVANLYSINSVLVRVYYILSLCKLRYRQRSLTALPIPIGYAVLCHVM